MSLFNFLPNDICELPLLWLSLPDLLRRAKEDDEVKRIINQPHFWKIKLHDEYHVEAKTNHPFEEYAHCYWPVAIEDGFLFEMGQLGLTLTEEEAEMIKGSLNACPYIIGACVAGCENKMPTWLRHRAIRNALLPCVELHRGEYLSIKQRLAVEDHLRTNLLLLSEEMLDNLIKSDMLTPRLILRELMCPIKYSSDECTFSHPKNVYLIEYFVHRYRDRLTKDDLREEIDHLEYGQKINDSVIKYVMKLLG
jgi:hypothetical protein